MNDKEWAKILKIAENIKSSDYTKYDGYKIDNINVGAMAIGFYRPAYNEYEDACLLKIWKHLSYATAINRLNKIKRFKLVEI